MEYFYVVTFIVFMFVFWFANFFGIPGNWLNIGLAFLWKLLFSSFSWYFWFALVGIAIVGEGLEFYFQWWISKKYGGTTKGNIGSFVGAIAGAILGAPFFLGIGAILGAILGAFLGSFLIEVMGSKGIRSALSASKGAAIGKAAGFSIKSGLGMVIIVMLIIKMWP